MKFDLATTRLTAYASLWEITGLGAPIRRDAQGANGHLTEHERSQLWAAMTDWYFAKGNGMLLEAKTRQVYLKAKQNLICPDAQIIPKELYEYLRKQLSRTKGPITTDDPPFSEAARGLLSIAQLSLLRTQMKWDLAVLVRPYTGELEPHEVYFLEGCGINLRRRPWARKLLRRPRESVLPPAEEAEDPLATVFDVKQRLDPVLLAEFDPSWLSSPPVPPSSRNAVPRDAEAAAGERGGSPATRPASDPGGADFRSH